MIPVGAGFDAERQRGICGRDFRQEAVAAPRDGFYESRALGRIAEGISDLIDCFIEAVVEINEGAFRPKVVPQFFAANDLSRACNQHCQNLKRLVLQSHSHAVLAQLALAKIQFEDSETEGPRRMLGSLHWM